MIKLVLTLIVVFTFGTSTVNAEENTTSIEDRISELTVTKSESQSIIKAKVDELSEDELKTVIANINELTEPTEDDLAIKEAAISKLEEMKSVEEHVNTDDDYFITVSNFHTADYRDVLIGVLGLFLLFYAMYVMVMGYKDSRIWTIIIGTLWILVMHLFKKG